MVSPVFAVGQNAFLSADWLLNYSVLTGLCILEQSKQNQVSLRNLVSVFVTPEASSLRVVSTDADINSTAWHPAQVVWDSRARVPHL
jgi:hypothetical protein